MTKAEIQKKIETLEKGIKSSATPEQFKGKMKEQIEKLQKELAQLESKKPKPKKEKVAKEKKEPKKEPETPKSGKVSSLKVGGEITIEDSIVKRTDSNVWLLQYKGNAKDTVAIEQKGSEFHADCCEKQGIVYKDLDKAVEAIIGAKDCHYEMEKRKERAKDASESRKIREKMTEGEKIASSLEKTADATENKTDNIEDKADKISKADADKITASIKSIISNVSDNFKDNSIKKQFLLKLKSEIESELKKM